MVPFLGQFEMGSGDYTRDRKEWLKELTAQQVVKEIEEQRNEQGSGSDAGT